jgi:hypothetical protein
MTLRDFANCSKVILMQIIKNLTSNFQATIQNTMILVMNVEKLTKNFTTFSVGWFFEKENSFFMFWNEKPKKMCGGLKLKYRDQCFNSFFFIFSACN